MVKKDILGIIKGRRSIRKYRNKPVPGKLADKIIEAGRWAPSGLNNQPWRFAVITDKQLINRMSECTEYSGIVLGAPLLIAVFCDNRKEYNRTKDMQAVGACLQNMLLECHSLGLGACWLGEILNSKQKAAKLLNAPKSYELMAVLSVGYPAERGRSSRVKTEKLVFRRR